jgi:hypothetical protein
MRLVFLLRWSIFLLLIVLFALPATGIFIAKADYPVSGSSAGGEVWTVKEYGDMGNWDGIWVRRPGTNTFDASWSGGTVHDVLTLEPVWGNRVTLHRQGNDGYYIGKLSPDGTSIVGKGNWYDAGETWTVTITGGKLAVTPYGVWDFSWGTSKHVTMEVKTDGTANQYDETGRFWNRGTWRQQGNSYLFTWETCGQDCTGDSSTDTLTLSSDGQKLTGTNNYGSSLLGIRKDATEGRPVTSSTPSVVTVTTTTATTTAAPSGGSQSPVGSWDYSWGTSQHVTMDIKPDGTVTQSDEAGTWNRGTWSQQGNICVFTWETCGRGCTGKSSSDTLTLSPDGQRLTGTNNYGSSLLGIRKTGSTGTSVTSSTPSVVTVTTTTATTTAAPSGGSQSPVGSWDYSWGTSQHVTMDIKPDGTVTQYDEAGAWNRGTWSQQGSNCIFTWETCGRGCTGKGSTDTLTLSSDGQKLTGTNNYGNSLLGIRKTGAAATPAVSKPVSATAAPASVTTSGTAQPTSKGCSGSETSLYIDDRTLNSGQELVVPIMICNAHDIANMDLSVGYDSKMIQFKDAIKGALTQNMLFESNNVGNTVKISFAGKTGFSGSGSVAVLTFTIIGQNGGSTPITVTIGGASTSDGKPVVIPVNNGKVIIGNPNPNDPGGRGKPTSLDALIALQISVGKRPNDLNYDVTKDGTVNSNDAREILKLAVQ